MIRTTGIINTPIGGRKDPNIYAINRDSMQLIDPAVNQSTAYQKTLLSYDPKMPIIKRMVDNQIDQTQVFNTKKRRTGNIGNTPISKIGLGQAVQGINNTGSNAPTNIAGMGTSQPIIKEEPPAQEPIVTDMNYYPENTSPENTGGSQASTIIQNYNADNERLPITSVVNSSTGVVHRTRESADGPEDTNQPVPEQLNPGQSGPSGLEPQTGSPGPSRSINNNFGPAPAVLNPLSSTELNVDYPPTISEYPFSSTGPTNVTYPVVAPSNQTISVTRVTEVREDTTENILNDPGMNLQIYNSANELTRIMNTTLQSGMTMSPTLISNLVSIFSRYIPDGLLSYRITENGNALEIIHEAYLDTMHTIDDAASSAFYGFRVGLIMALVGYTGYQLESREQILSTGARNTMQGIRSGYNAAAPLVGSTIQKTVVNFMDILRWLREVGNPRTYLYNIVTAANDLYRARQRLQAQARNHPRQIGNTSQLQIENASAAPEVNQTTNQTSQPIPSSEGMGESSRGVNRVFQRSPIDTTNQRPRRSTANHTLGSLAESPVEVTGGGQTYAATGKNATSPEFNGKTPEQNLKQIRAQTKRARENTVKKGKGRKS